MLITGERDHCNVHPSHQALQQHGPAERPHSPDLGQMSGSCAVAVSKC